MTLNTNPSTSQEPQEVRLSTSPGEQKQECQSSTSETFHGAYVTCKDLTYKVHRRNTRKWMSLIAHVDLILRPNNLTAVLGPSGCGKTTLLDVLAGRKTTGQTEGKVLYDGRLPVSTFLRRHVGYCEQSDTLLGFLTPSEMLLYTAQLKHSRKQPFEEKKAQVSALIKELGLEDCRDTIIGSSAHRGLSGGESKRTNVAIALITNPQVLYIDELTSGLDSFTAHEVVCVIKRLADKGMTVFCSIHTPPPYTFELFDIMLILQRGRVVYFGGNGEVAERYFTHNFPDLRHMKGSEGIADYVIDVTTRANHDPDKVAAFADGYAKSELYQQNKKLIEEWEMPGIDTSIAQSNGDVEQGSLPFTEGSKKKEKGTVTPMWWALLILLQFRSLKSYQQKAFVMPRIGDKILVVFLIVTVWWRIGSDPINESATTIAAILFLWSMLSAFLAMGSLPTIVLERPIYTRERQDGLYLPITYAVYKIIEELVPQIFTGLIYSALVFYLVKLDGSFLLFWLVYLVSTANALAMTFFISACSPNTSVAGALASSYATTLFFFSGFLIPYDLIPVYWRWYATIDHLRYAFGVMMVNQFGPAGSENDPPFAGGQTILQYYSLEGVDAWAWLGFEALFFPVFVGLLCIALTWFKHTRR